MTSDAEAIHLEPIWGDKANFVIAANLGDEGGEQKWEQLWARKIDERLFELCCIPFFAYDLSLGDEVRTDDDFTIIGVSKRSEHSTFRIWFGDSDRPRVREEVTKLISDRGMSFEWSSGNLLAIDVPANVNSLAFERELHEMQAKFGIIFERGRA